MKLENLPPVYEAYSAEYPDLTVCRIVLQEKELYHVIHKDGMMQAQVSDMMPELYLISLP